MTIKENQDRDFDFDEHLEADFLVSSAGVCMRNLGTLPVDFYVSSLGVCVRNPEAEALDAFNRQPVTDADFEELPSSPPRPVPPPFTPSISTDDLLAGTRELLARTRARLAHPAVLLGGSRPSREP